MTISDWTTLVAVGSGIVGATLGATWWMSALYARVRDIDDKLSEFIGDAKADRHTMWTEINETKRMTHALDVRVTRLEQQT